MVAGRHIKIYEIWEVFDFEVECFIDGKRRYGGGSAPTLEQAFDEAVKMLEDWSAE